MGGLLGIRWGLPILVSLLILALGATVIACGSPSSPSASGAPSAEANAASPAALATPTAMAADRPNLPSSEIIAALEGRIAAMNEGDGAAAAAFYTADGVLEETDLAPHGFAVGQEQLAARFDELYSLGLRLGPGGSADRLRQVRGRADTLLQRHRAGPRGRDARVRDRRRRQARVPVDDRLGRGPEETFAIR